MQNLKNNKKYASSQDRSQKETLPSPRDHYKNNSQIIPTVSILPNFFVGENEVFLEALKEYKKYEKYNISWSNGKNKLAIIDASEYLERKYK